MEKLLSELRCMDQDHQVKRMEILNSISSLQTQTYAQASEVYNREREEWKTERERLLLDIKRLEEANKTLHQKIKDERALWQGRWNRVKRIQEQKRKEVEQRKKEGVTHTQPEPVPVASMVTSIAEPAAPPGSAVSKTASEWFVPETFVDDEFTDFHRDERLPGIPPSPLRMSSPMRRGSPTEGAVSLSSSSSEHPMGIESQAAGLSETRLSDWERKQEVAFTDRERRESEDRDLKAQEEIAQLRAEQQTEPPDSLDIVSAALLMSSPQLQACTSVVTSTTEPLPAVDGPFSPLPSSSRAVADGSRTSPLSPEVAVRLIDQASPCFAPTLSSGTTPASTVTPTSTITSAVTPTQRLHQAPLESSPGVGCGSKPRRLLADFQNDVVAEIDLFRQGMDSERDPPPLERDSSTPSVNQRHMSFSLDLSLPDSSQTADIGRNASLQDDDEVVIIDNARSRNDSQSNRKQARKRKSDEHRSVLGDVLPSPRPSSRLGADLYDEFPSLTPDPDLAVSRRPRPGKENTPLQADDLDGHPKRATLTRQHSTERREAYVETERRKSVRETMPGYECEDCKAWYQSMGKPYSRRQVCNHVSRHRYQSTPPPTPPGYWSVSTPPSPTSGSSGTGVERAVSDRSDPPLRWQKRIDDHQESSWLTM